MRQTAPVAPRPGRTEGPPRTPEDLRAYLPYLVNRLSNRLTIDQGKLLAERGLTNAALRTLSVLHIYRRLTVNEISVLAVLEQSTANRTVDQMLAAGLVTRENGASDQRRREVAPTAKGERLLKGIWPLVERNRERLADGIERDDIETCVRVLTRMIDNVRQHDL